MLHYFNGMDKKLSKFTRDFSNVKFGRDEGRLFHFHPALARKMKLRIEDIDRYQLIFQKRPTKFLAKPGRVQLSSLCLSSSFPSVSPWKEALC